MKILIGSPTYDGSVRKEYMRSIMVLTDYFRQSGIAWDIRLENSTLLHVMRSVMASEVLLDPDFTHLLFVDTDMGFSVNAVKKLIAAQRDVIGCAYPYRTIPLHEPAAAEDGETLRRLVSRSVPYAVNLPPGRRNVTKGICEVISIGTGLLLISSQALDRMRPKVGEYQAGFPYNQWYRHGRYFGFFDHLVLDGKYVGEDYSFCQRWTKDCGGKVYAVVDEEIMHVGPLPVLGRYMDRLKSGKH